MAGMRTDVDGCSSAHALDLVGERWALLIVRDLLFGPKRFTDLQAGLPQGSPNVLTQRLRELEAAGIVRRRKLPPPAAAMVYELTDWGAQLEPILMGLQRWGAGSPAMSHEVPVGCDAAMLALKNMFSAEAAAAFEAVVEIRFDTGTFGVAVRDGAIEINRGAARHADVVIATDPVTLEEVAFGMRTIKEAERSSALRFEGDREVAMRFLGLFPVPAG